MTLFCAERCLCCLCLKQTAHRLMGLLLKQCDSWYNWIVWHLKLCVNLPARCLSKVSLKYRQHVFVSSTQNCSCVQTKQGRLTGSWMDGDSSPPGHWCLSGWQQQRSDAVTRKTPYCPITQMISCCSETLQLRRERTATTNNGNGSSDGDNKSRCCEFFH